MSSGGGRPPDDDRRRAASFRLFSLQQRGVRAWRIRTRARFRRREENKCSERRRLISIPGGNFGADVRIPCKYFARGTCFKGEHCNFSHDWRDQPNKVCTFYQKGLCTYGNRCRYNHVIVSDQVTTDATSKSYSYRESSSSRIASPSRAFFSGETSQSFIVPEVVSAPNQFHAYFRGDTSPSKGNNHAPDLADMQICSLNIASSCPHGERCSRIHGEQCYVCGKYCLHPFRPKEREEHIRTCQKNNKLLETIKYSQEIECSICLERVLSKPTDAERKFGILPDCDHPFCIECIRIWRKNSAASGIDLNTAVRACPVCRKHSHFVVPSFIWFSTQEEKQEIIDNYKEKLKSIDCKYFEFGNGICPFGSICFYKHTKLYESPRTGFRPLRHRPRIHSLIQLAEDDEDEDEDEELDGIVDRHDLEQDFANFSSLFDTDEEEPESVDDSDFCNFLAMSLLLMQMTDEELLSDDDGDGN